MAKKKIYKRWWFWLIIIILVVGIANLGSSNEKDVASNAKEKAVTTEQKEDSKEKTKKEDTKVTYENFLKVTMGQSYEETCSILGEGTEVSSSQVGDISTKMYEWKGNGISNMNVTIQNNIVTSKAQIGLEKNFSDINLEKYNKVTEGMTLDEATSILGEGQILSQSNLMDIETTMYTWINKDGSNCNLTIQGGNVTMKAQFNLK